MSVKHELQNIISGNGPVGNGETIRSITAYLRRKKKAIPEIKGRELSKGEEEVFLKEYISISDLWYFGINVDKYIGEGAEQKIYEFSDPNFVLKSNHSIFYSREPLKTSNFFTSIKTQCKRWAPLKMLIYQSKLRFSLVHPPRTSLFLEVPSIGKTTSIIYRSIIIFSHIWLTNCPDFSSWMKNCMLLQSSHSQKQLRIQICKISKIF